MTRRKSIIGLCMLCALAVSGLAAQSASAVFTGTTAYACKEVASGAQFSDAHCKTAGSGAGFKHEAIANGTTTEVKGTNITTGSELSHFTLHWTGGGIEVEITAKEVEGTGEMHNLLVGEEHQATGTGTAVFRGVKMPKPVGPNGEKCAVKTDVLPGKTEGGEGVIDTELLKATTASQGDAVKFEPVAGPDEPFARFFIVQNPANPTEKCPVVLGPKTWTVIGSVVSSKIEGATIIFERAQTTAQKALRIGGTEGPVAGLTGSLTLSARANSSDTYKPLSPTTT